ncbi:hypothetical protein E0W68_11535 [Flavobacterium salilacus subsp. salilacus]|uniref:hypothetical protein n=1 Tax=Flavobacterium TaxID=237 RepID=UPI001074E858|nr:MULTISPECIES: hypothetical protein [Flavobacterium]KAF2516840.1 hypothetical protein E0W68_11535 [Flavobacterium salilacus subsp. salilacus]MBE1615801.1 hypothetical protein [Flavobacterium sp. SaA2.13]
MPNNYRRIPHFIQAKLNNFQQENVQVSIVKRISERDFDSQGFRNFNFRIENNNLNYLDNFIPEATNGTYSKRNINGFKITHRDQEKIYKTWYAGERPIYGDWTKGSFSLYIRKLAYPSTTIPPKELSINLEILNDELLNNERYFTVRVYVDECLNRNDENFLIDLLCNINLLQENFREVDVHETNLTREEYLRTLVVDWDFFPPGTREGDIQRILNRRPNANRNYINTLGDRYDVMMSLNPQNIISGKSGMRNYFGVQYAENLVAFENLQYGNAIYILFENWRELSTLSRTELLKRPEDQFFRIEHKFGWQTLFARTIRGKRTN